MTGWSAASASLTTWRRGACRHRPCGRCVISVGVGAWWCVRLVAAGFSHSTHTHLTQPIYTRNETTHSPVAYTIEGQEAPAAASAASAAAEEGGE